MISFSDPRVRIVIGIVIAAVIAVAKAFGVDVPVLPGV